jgi:hypothetical protein
VTLEGRNTVEELAKQGVTAGRVATRSVTTEGDGARDRRWSGRARDATTEVTTSNTGPESAGGAASAETADSAVPAEILSRGSAEGAEGGRITEGTEGLPADHVERVTTVCG